MITIKEAVEHKPPTFRELSDVDKGVLLLAKHEKVARLEWYSVGDHKWRCLTHSAPIADGFAHRIAPMRINGTVKVDADGKPDFETWEAT